MAERIVLALAIGLTWFSGCGNVTAPEACGCQTLWLSPLGSDTNAGSYGSPWKTLERAETYLLANTPNANIDIKMIANQGDYLNMFTNWSYYRSGRTITIEGWPDSIRAVCRMTVDSTRNDRFFDLIAEINDYTRITFRGLRIVHYSAGAINLVGDRHNEGDGWLGKNVVEHCTFDSIGNFDAPEMSMTYGVLDFVNSRYDTVRNCRFSDCSNAAQAIIAIYLAHHSCYNQIYADTFWNVYGDGVRMRDGSNGNEIRNNWFEKTGNQGAVSMWYCVPPYSTCGFLECPSYGNLFHDNLVTGNKLCQIAPAFQDIQTFLYGSCPDEGTRMTEYNNTIDTCLYHTVPPDTGGIN